MDAFLAGEIAFVRAGLVELQLLLPGFEMTAAERAEALDRIAGKIPALLIRLLALEARLQRLEMSRFPVVAP